MFIKIFFKPMPDSVYKSRFYLPQNYSINDWLIDLHADTYFSRRDKQPAIKPLIQATPNPKTELFLVLSSSCLCPIHWSQMLSPEWSCS